MYDIMDVANWFLRKEQMTHKKLQKLCYYAQAWNCAFSGGAPMMNCDFEAWVHGPVCRELWDKYKGFMPWDKISPESGETVNFDPDTENLLESVWLTYGDLNGYQLEVLTHREKPWQIARGDLPSDRICTTRISNDDMKNYYLSLHQGDGNGE